MTKAVKSIAGMTPIGMVSKLLGQRRQNQGDPTIGSDDEEIRKRRLARRSTGQANTVIRPAPLV